MKKFFAPWFLLVCGLAFLGGCSSSSRIIAVGLRPEITAIERAGDGSVNVTWQIVNTNIVPYLLSEVEHKIFVNGTEIGRVRSSSPLAVPAQTNAGATDRLELSGNAASLLSAAAGSSANYRVETRITIQIYGDNTEKSQIAHTGTVTVVNK